MTMKTYSAEILAEKAERGPVTVPLVGEDGNAFAILGRVGKSLRRAGYSQEARDAFMADAQSGDYNHLLQTAMDWVEEPDEDEEDVY
jgi:hypothetical protein